jgi:hypothetical protein
MRQTLVLIGLQICVGTYYVFRSVFTRTGLHATGIGSVSCARHEMYRPNGMGDLQKGERYVIQDLFTAKSNLHVMF